MTLAYERLAGNLYQNSQHFFDSVHEKVNFNCEKDWIELIIYDAGVSFTNRVKFRYTISDHDDKRYVRELEATNDCSVARASRDLRIDSSLSVPILSPMLDKRNYCLATLRRSTTACSRSTLEPLLLHNKRDALHLKRRAILYASVPDLLIRDFYYIFYFILFYYIFYFILVTIIKICYQQ